VVYYITDPVT